MFLPEERDNILKKIMSDYTYKHEISARDYNDLRVGAGWRSLDLKQAETGLKNASFLISAWDVEKPVGVARVISDRGYIYLIVDVIVTPAYQGQGIGTRMIRIIEDWLVKEKEGKPTMMVYLMAAEGKESFYERFGFRRRPCEDHMGAGMTKWMD